MDLFALLVFLLRSYLLFLPKIEGRGAGPLGPSPRSAKETLTVEKQTAPHKHIAFYAAAYNLCGETLVFHI